MKILANVLEDNTIKTLLEISKNVISGNSNNYKVWTNLGWDKRIVLGSGTIICIAVPGNLVLEIEKKLISLGIIDLGIHKSLFETKTAWMYIYPNGAYIPPHKDSIYAKAISIYLNKDWSLSDGGLFCYSDNNEIKCVIPEYNLGVQNTQAEQHFTTPVTSDKLRISLQIFVINK